MTPLTEETFNIYHFSDLSLCDTTNRNKSLPTFTAHSKITDFDSRMRFFDRSIAVHTLTEIIFIFAHIQKKDAIVISSKFFVPGPPLTELLKKSAYPLMHYAQKNQTVCVSLTVHLLGPWS